MAILTSGQTPLLGGETPSLQEGTGFSGSAPRRQRMTTPSALALGAGASASGGVGGSTPVPGTPSTVGGRTPGGRGGFGAAVGAGTTPMRDEV